MPTSRYENYPLPKETESKEEVVGDTRLTQELGKAAIESAVEED